MTWTTMPLGEICDIRIGRTPSRSRQDYWGAGHPWLSIGDMNQGRHLRDTKESITPLAVREAGCKEVEVGTVLLSFKLSIGKVGIAAQPIYTNEAIAGLPIVRCDLVTPDYLYWALRSMDVSTGFNRAAMGATLNKAALQRIPISIPPMAEQRRITDVLDQADAMRTKRRAALVLFESLIPSIFVEMFGDQASNPHGWPCRPLATLIAVGDRLNYGVIQPGENVAGGVPLIRVGDLVGGRVDRSAIKHIDARIDANYPRSRLRGEEVLVSCVGTIGVVALAGPEDAGSNIARAVARVRLGADIERDYIASYLRQPAVQRYFTGELRTVTQPTLNIKQLAETPILLPPLHLQRAFCDRVRTCDSVRDQSDRQRSELDTLLDSLQKRVFAGEPLT